MSDGSCASWLLLSCGTGRGPGHLSGLRTNRPAASSVPVASDPRWFLEVTRPGGTLVAAGCLDPRPTPRGRRHIGHRPQLPSFDQLADPAVVRRMAAFLDAGLRPGVVRPEIDTVSLPSTTSSRRIAGSGRGCTPGGRSPLTAGGRMPDVTTAGARP